MVRVIVTVIVIAIVMVIEIETVNVIVIEMITVNGNMHGSINAACLPQQRIPPPSFP